MAHAVVAHVPTNPCHVRLLSPPAEVAQAGGGVYLIEQTRLRRAMVVTSERDASSEDENLTRR
jgi:hypothetical protein